MLKKKQLKIQNRLISIYLFHELNETTCRVTKYIEKVTTCS